jgi:general secretion pathway protein B
MSSILKALKKLEQEKTSRRGGTPDIARGILRSVPKGRQRPRWLFPVSVTGTALAASLFTYVLMSGFPHTTRSAAPAAKQQEAVESPVVIVPKIPALPAGDDEGLRPTKYRSVDAASKSVRTEKYPISGGPSAGKIKPSTPLSVAAGKASSFSVTSPPLQKKQEPSGRVAQTAQPSSGHPLPALVVTGIAWQKGGADKVAVVNNMSVTEGVTVEGARVEEIFQDRVRFSFGGQRFDVALGKPGSEK